MSNPDGGGTQSGVAEVLFFVLYALKLSGLTSVSMIVIAYELMGKNGLMVPKVGLKPTTLRLIKSLILYRLSLILYRSEA